MAMVTFCNNDHQLSQPLSFENNRNNLRDVSFSSYLNSTEEFFVLKLTESGQNLNPISTNAEKDLFCLGSKKAEDGEIDVFDAEKYFNGGMDDEKLKVVEKTSRKNNLREDKPVYIDPIKTKIQTGTPSVRSESSWNSQSALLQSVFRHTSRRHVKKVQGKSLFASFGCRCSCADKNSVEIDEHASCGEVHGRNGTKDHYQSGLILPDVAQIHTKTRENNQAQTFRKLVIEPNREMNSTFPNTVPGVGSMPTKLLLQEEEKPRNSLEVFGSPIHDKRNKSLSIDRRPTMLLWDEGILRGEEIEIPSGNCGVYTDTESDASSDLFEIDSLTGKPNQFLLRQASDGLSGCVTPTTCYAPSEASIDWSVITASAVDFSAMSDSEELRPSKFVGNSSIKKVTTPPRGRTITNKDNPKRISSSLLGCKSQKAVRVAGDPYVTNENKAPRTQHKPELFAPVSRFQAEAKVLGFDPRNGKRHSFTTRAHSSQGSHLLCIQ